MSSSNLVSIRMIEETVLGETPVSGNFSTVRFTSESLSGSPQTTESQQIRTDRLSSGQIVTGLEVQGDINFELAKESSLEQLLASAMFNNWTTLSTVLVDLEYDATAKTLERASGDWAATLEVGDIITTSGFTNNVNNTQHQILEFISATVVRVVSNAQSGPLVSEVGSSTDYKRADKLAIGTVKKSFSVEKAFTDLTTKALVYKGMIVDSLSLNVAYGEIITGAFTLSGTGYENADTAGEFITNGRTINPAATTNSLNGSIDMPFIASNVLGDFDPVDFCIQNVSLQLNNNLSAQNCIGKAAPKDYSAGTANVEVNLSAYLANENWSLLQKKLTQEPFALGFMVKNFDGWYGFYMPAVQVSFDDPSSGGANQDISLEMSGVAKVGPNGEKSLYIYRA